MDVWTFRCRRAFSLIEVLLAIFILGIGVISIAALFPAAIAQQRQSVDDIHGPMIANNALALLRLKVKPEYFGTFEQFGPSAPVFTVAGDFPWMRPGFIFADDVATTTIDEEGAIDIFTGDPNTTASEFFPPPFGGSYGGTTPPLEGIPYNLFLFPTAPPRILISQQERYYPAQNGYGTGDAERPQYVWDCMFRKFQGKVLVAIFVYRVTVPGGGSAAYIVQPNPANPAVPPLPIHLDLTDPAVQTAACAGGPWHPGGPDGLVATIVDDASTTGVNESNSVVLGVPGGTAFSADDHQHAWQEARQWIIDQNNNVHRVVGATREDENDDVQIELVRAAPAMPDLAASGSNNVYSIDTGTNAMVSDIWYMPLSIADANGVTVTLTPIYATVKEL